MHKIGFIFAIVGAAGIAGAIEQGESLLLPVIAFLAGTALWYIGEQRGGAKDKRSTNRNSNNVRSYPAGLESTRRRRA